MLMLSLSLLLLHLFCLCSAMALNSSAILESQLVVGTEFVEPKKTQKTRLRSSYPENCSGRPCPYGDLDKGWDMVMKVYNRYTKEVLPSLSNHTRAAVQQNTSLPRFMLLKSARTGSTWFSKTLREFRYRVLFEPFTGKKKASAQTNKSITGAFNSFFKRPAKVTIREVGRENGFCVEVNPYFIPELDFPRFLAERSPAISVVNLRRTNVVKQAVSKLDHGGCGQGSIPGSSVNASADDLLQCIEYVLTEQNGASFMSYLSPVPVLLVLYEDMNADSWQMYKTLFSWLGDARSAAKVPWFAKQSQKDTTRKVHSDDLCTFLKHCDQIKRDWSDRPCLLQQLASTSSQAFSLPVRNGALDLKGTCHVLPPLKSLKTKHRQLSDLFIGPDGNNLKF